MMRKENEGDRIKKRRTWKQAVSAMACIVVFVVTYALILPAITLEKGKTDQVGLITEEAAETVISAADGYQETEVPFSDDFDPVGENIATAVDLPADTVQMESPVKTAYAAELLKYETEAYTASARFDDSAEIPEGTQFFLLPAAESETYAEIASEKFGVSSDHAESLFYRILFLNHDMEVYPQNTVDITMEYKDYEESRSGGTVFGVTISENETVDLQIIPVVGQKVNDMETDENPGAESENTSVENEQAETQTVVFDTEEVPEAEDTKPADDADATEEKTAVDNDAVSGEEENTADETDQASMEEKSESEDVSDEADKQPATEETDEFSEGVEELFENNAGFSEETDEPAEGTEETAESTEEPEERAEESAENTEDTAENIEESEEGAEESAENTEETAESTEESEEGTEESAEETEETAESTEESEEDPDASAEADRYSDGELIYTGNDYTVSLAYTADACIPEDAEVSVRELEPGTEEYDQYLTAAKQAMGLDTSASLPAEQARFFDITILAADGETELEPKAAVTVQITYDEPMIIPDTDQMSALHFADDSAEPEILEVQDVQTESHDEAAVTAVTFDSESFSVFGIVYTVDFYYEIDGKVFAYSIKGGSAISLRELLPILGAVSTDEADEFVSEVANVQFSNESLVKIAQIMENTTVGELKNILGLEIQYAGDLTDDDIANINAKELKAGDWVLLSLQPFDTDETLTVTMNNGDQWTIRVTDAQEDTGYVTVNDLGHAKLRYLNRDYQKLFSDTANINTVDGIQRKIRNVNGKNQDSIVALATTEGYAFSRWELTNKDRTNTWISGNIPQKSTIMSGTLSLSTLSDEWNTVTAVFVPVYHFTIKVHDPENTYLTGHDSSNESFTDMPTEYTAYGAANTSGQTVVHANYDYQIKAKDSSAFSEVFWVRDDGEIIVGTETHSNGKNRLFAFT